MIDQDLFHIQIPKTMSELQKIYQKNPKASLMAGGTYILNHLHENKSEGRTYISLNSIEELKKVSRSDRYLEIGSCVTIQDLLDSNLLPPESLLRETLRQIGTIPLRNMATIGGNISIKSKRMDLFPVLLLLESRIELKQLFLKKNKKFTYKTRWIYMSSLIGNEGELHLNKGEIITKTRVPFYFGNFYYSQKIHIKENSYFILNCLATVEKGLISDIRLAITTGGPFIFRYREFESNLLGRRLPFSKKEKESLLENLLNYFPLRNNPYESTLTRGLFFDLLNNLENSFFYN